MNRFVLLAGIALCKASVDVVIIYLIARFLAR